VKLPSIRSALHARAELVIPWLANGSLPAEAEPAVREHIAGCAKCREDYEEQLRVCEAMRADGPLVFAAESSYQKLLTRVQSAEFPAETPVESVEVRPAPETLRPAPAARPFRQASPVVRCRTAGLRHRPRRLGVAFVRCRA